jgi:hypothetical protein
MSDLGRVFHLSEFYPRPLENFTTEALATAIGHDDRPMKRALRSLDRSYHDKDWRLAFAKSPVSVAKVVTITAKTQLMLPAGIGLNGIELKLGYLDLVLTLQDAHQRESVIWVEVKVDAWEGTDQLANYRNHANQPSRIPSPLIITLGRRRVAPSVPALKWSDVANAIASVPAPHESWLDLREFLLNEKIVRPPVPLRPLDAGECIKIIVDVNRRLRDEVWRGLGITWRSDETLRRALVTSFTKFHEIQASGGPLRYGLVPAGNAWDWGLVVTTKNYERVRLDPQEILRDADIGGLPETWQRHSDRSDVLERRAPLDSLPHDEIITWFETGLGQLRDARILERYRAGLGTKRMGAVVSQSD